MFFFFGPNGRIMALAEYSFNWREAKKQHNFQSAPMQRAISMPPQYRPAAAEMQLLHQAVAIEQRRDQFDFAV